MTGRAVATPCSTYPAVDAAASPLPPPPKTRPRSTGYVNKLLLQYMARVEHPQHGPVINIAVRLRVEVVADLIRLLP